MKEFMHILIAGETWISHFTNIKGRNEYSGAEFYENPGVLKLMEVLKEKGHAVKHIPNHKAVYDFPFSLEELSAYDCVVLSDIGSDTLLLHPDTVNLKNPQRLPDRLKITAGIREEGRRPPDDRGMDVILGDRWQSQVPHHSLGRRPAGHHVAL